MLPNLKLILLLLLTTIITSTSLISRSPWVRCSSERPNGSGGQEDEVAPAGAGAGAGANGTSKAGQRDVWDMMASMRQAAGASGITGRTEASSSPFSRSLKLEWTIELDAEANYKLSWRANLSQNEILFALDINVSGSDFFVGADIFGLGFSERGQLESSDFCLVWYDLSREVRLQDARTSANNTLELLAGPGEGACKLLNHHHSRGPDAESALLRAEIDYEDAEEAEEAGRGASPARALAELDGQPAAAAPDDNLELIFTRPLEPCPPDEAGPARRWRARRSRARPWPLRQRQRQRQRHYAIDNGTTHLVWFALHGPRLALDGMNLTEALEREQAGPSKRSGLRRVQLMATRPPKASRPPARWFDVRMANYAIPASETTYMCKLFRLPGKFERRRYHITGYEAAIEAGKEHVVHHMELFNCANLNGLEARQLEGLANRSGAGWSGECGSRDRPAATHKCKRVILAWAMGARPLAYPLQVGQSIGGPGYSPYVMLEVHYNNVNQQAGLVDSSGLRFHYSGRLRPFEAGVLEVGLEYTDKNSVPPRMLAPLAGHCVSECTRAALSERGADGGRPGPGPGLGPGGGIYVFAAQMHTHLAGVASWTEHVRGGQLLGELQRDDHYSAHFQEIRLLAEPVHVAPGDALIHYCLYDTRARSNITLGGFATADEMCVTYLHYYPKMDLEVCKSSVDTGALSDYFAQLARDEAQQTTALIEAGGADNEANQQERRLKSISDNYRSIRWSARRSRELIQFYQTAPLSIQCNRSDGSSWPGQWTGIEPSKFSKVHADFRRSLVGAPAFLEPAELAKQKSARELLDYRGLGALRRGALCAGSRAQWPAR